MVVFIAVILDFVDKLLLWLVKRIVIGIMFEGWGQLINVFKQIFMAVTVGSAKLSRKY